MPAVPGLAVALFIGVLAGVCVGPRCGRLGLLAVVTVGQAVSHLALAVGSHPGHMTGSMTHTSSMTHAGAHVVDMHGVDTAPPTSMLTEHLTSATDLHSTDGLVMMATHLVAVPLCVALIAVAGALAAVVSTVVAVITRAVSPGPVTATVPVDRGVLTPPRRVDRAAGAGVRGPPGTAAFA